MRSSSVRALIASIALLAATAGVATAATETHLTAQFTQHFGGRNGDGVTCPGDAINCGAGRVDGLGTATDAFYFSDEEGFRHTLTLANGSSLTVVLGFIIETKPGGSGDARQHTSYGNPDDVYFDAVVIDGSGSFAGAQGGGVMHLEQAGNVDQISLDLDLTLS